MNHEYRSIFVSRIAAALGAARAVSTLSHQGVKGAVREVLLRELFRPLLPIDMGVGTGQIASSSGALSREQDVVIYDRRILPPVLFEGILGVFPLEAVLATVEVKTVLTAANLALAHESARGVRQYLYLHGQKDRVTGEQVSHPVERVMSCVFALSTDLAPSGKTEIQRYREMDDGTDPVIRSICVTDRGYWYFSDQWQSVATDAEHSETLLFVTGIYDKLAEIAESRQRPRLAGYVL